MKSLKNIYILLLYREVASYEPLSKFYVHIVSYQIK